MDLDLAPACDSPASSGVGRQLAALAWLALAACRAEPSRTAQPTVEGATGATQLLASAPFYRLEATPEPCTSGAPCQVSLVLTALGDYKLNKEYPFKLVPHAQSPATAHRVGSLERSAERRGVMKVELVAPALPSSFTGVFKLSVCTEDVCEIADPEISVTLPTAPR